MAVIAAVRIRVLCGRIDWLHVYAQIGADVVPAAAASFLEPAQLDLWPRMGIALPDDGDQQLAGLAAGWLARCETASAAVWNSIAAECRLVRSFFRDACHRRSIRRDSSSLDHRHRYGSGVLLGLFACSVAADSLHRLDRIRLLSQLSHLADELKCVAIWPVIWSRLPAVERC